MIVLCDLSRSPASLNTEEQVASSMTYPPPYNKNEQEMGDCTTKYPPNTGSNLSMMHKEHGSKVNMLVYWDILGGSKL